MKRQGWTMIEDAEGFEGAGCVWEPNDGENVPWVYELADAPGRLGLGFFNPNTGELNCVVLPKFPAEMDADDQVQWAIEFAESYAANVGLRD